MKNTLLFICSTNILVRLLTVNMENCLTPQKSENMLPHYNKSSRENGTTASGTSPLASYKEVLPPHPPPPQPQNSNTPNAKGAVSCEDKLEGLKPIATDFFIRKRRIQSEE